MIRSRPVRRTIVIVAILVIAAPAVASPGDSPWEGAVFAGPTSPHPGNLVSNPATMLLATPAHHVFVGGLVGLEQLAIDRDAGPVSGTTMGAGGHLGYALVTPTLVLGFRTGMPLPEETVAGRDALRYHTRGSRSRNVEVGTVSFAARVTSRIWLGLAGTYNTRATVLRFARDTALEAGRDGDRGTTSDCGGAPCGLEHPLATETWTIDVDSDRFTLSNAEIAAGVLVTIPGGALLGVTYQRPWSKGRVARTGTATVIAAPRDGGGTYTGEATVYDQLPEVIRIGSRSRMRPRLDVVAEVRWRRLARIGADDVRTYGGDLAALGVPANYPRPRGLQDAYALELGVEEVDDGQVLRLGGRVGVDSGAVASERLSSRAPWGTQLTAGGGAQVRLGARWVIQAAYNVAWQLPVSVDPGAFDPTARLDCVDSGYDLSLAACDTLRAGYGAPSAAGDYRRWTHIGRLSLRLEIP